eukprot:TRINITY_DN33846_c0_g1_i1.p1 TRINITY_DN33846_c0_g1~~TRINITY_DN33846_c0_g1_i1.p1  ORF type:complete len:169 (-),score=13.27 TRINITY_DN33846_c0_g1_i1:62-568(-)
MANRIAEAPYKPPPTFLSVKQVSTRVKRQATVSFFDFCRKNPGEQPAEDQQPLMNTRRKGNVRDHFVVQRDVWFQQLSYLSRVPLGTLAAICQRYPTPAHLLRAWYQVDHQCPPGTDPKPRKLALLANLDSTRANGTKSRVGPAVAQKIYRLMHADDPDEFLDGGNGK